MAEKPVEERLEELDQRIKSARAAQEPEPRVESAHSAAGHAWRMVLELVIGLVIGFGIGYGLDSLFGTLPIFLILFILLGFAAGVRTMMHTAGEVQRKRSGNPAVISPEAGGEDED